MHAFELVRDNIDLNLNFFYFFILVFVPSREVARFPLERNSNSLKWNRATYFYTNFCQKTQNPFFKKIKIPSLAPAHFYAFQVPTQMFHD